MSAPVVVPAWLGDIVRCHIARLHLLRLEGAPLAEVMGEVTLIWAETLASRRSNWDCDQDSARLEGAFLELAATCERWPAPAMLLKLLPARPPAPALPLPDLSPAQRRRNLKRLATLFGEAGQHYGKLHHHTEAERRATGNHA